MSPILKSRSLYKEYIILSSFIITLVIIISIYIINTTKVIVNENKEKEIYFQAMQLEMTVNESLNYIEHYTKFLGNKIVEYGKPDINFIANLLHDKIPANLADDSFYSWSLFDFVNDKKFLVVNSIVGIYKNPIDMSIRSHLNKSDKEPWKLHFSEPSIGIPSGQYVVPAAMGIKDKKGIFYGTIVTGINISKLNNKLNFVNKSNKLVFLFFDEYGKLISNSNNINDVDKNNLMRIINEKIIKKDIKTQFLKDTINFDKYKFIYLNKFSKYPFFILMGEDTNLTKKEFNITIFPRIIELSFLGFFSIFSIFYLIRKIVKPIKDLSTASYQIAVDKEVTIFPSTYSEFNTLANNLKEIQRVKKELYHTQSLLRDANQGLADKIRERTSELEKALEVKTEFLNNISHEVRTPIHGVTAITQGIVDHWDDLEEERKRDLAKQAAVAANRLFSLVNNILDLSKMTNNKMELHLVNTDLVNLAKEVIEESRELYLHDKKVDLVIIEPKEQLPVLLIDKQLITQVFRNLITNAIKFTKEGKIEVSFERKDYSSTEGEEGIYIRIKDEGIGIPKGEEKDIFGAFTQSTRTKTRAGGTGLGLAICKEIVEMHAGKIWAENNSNKGASFYFVLPIDEEIEERTKQGEIREVPKVNILLIDDERLCIESMKMMLAGSEFEINGAEGGSAGLAYLGANSSKVDLILLDMMMPDMYGLDVLEKIKNNPQLDHIPVILQTGLKKEDEIQKAYDLGIVNFINKPYKKEEILKVLRTSVRFK